jgi:basic amino acid/polyamine antiporter, APA family
VTEGTPGGALARRLTTSDAVVVGLGAMIGAGVFAAFGPAAAAAGAGLLLGLAIAAVVAYCNATSSAQLAALYPEAGGTYVYGRERLGPFWGYLAGWGFVVGKTASCAAMALTFGAYVAPAHARPLAAAAVTAVTVVNLAGVKKTAIVTRIIVVLVLATLAFVVVAAVGGAGLAAANLGDPFASGTYGILQAAGLLFFAFAGFARIATLGEEVVDPASTIPRAIPLALGITLAVYVAVAVAALGVLGADTLATSAAPLAAVVEASPWSGAAPVVQAGAAIASFGVLLSLLVGVSRTTLAMARRAELPSVLAHVHPTRQVPQRAELTVASVVLVLVLVTDLRGAIGFSSFGVLTYYAVANASAFTLTDEERRWPRWLTILGVVGCAVLAATLPATSVLAGAGVLLVGVLIWVVRARRGVGTEG